MVAVQVDDRYRITIPKDGRGAIQPGDVLFFEHTVEHGIEVYRYAKAVNPFDVLAAHALRDYHAGQTVSLDEAFAEACDEPAE